MSKKRLINCEFLNASSFKVKLSNNAKLLYLFMFANADDRGFVDTTNEIVQSLEENDKEHKREINMSLLGTDYKSALDELCENGLLYEFTDNHQNRVYLIRHWYYHNKMLKGIWTNYRAFFDQVVIVDNEYIMLTEKEKEAKRKDNIKKLNEIKLNKVKLSEDKLSDGNTDNNDTKLNEEETNIFDEVFGKDEDERPSDD